MPRTDATMSNMIKQTAGLIIVTLALGACALQPTPYKPKDDSRYGYSEQRLEADRYRVRFAGNDVTERDTVQNYLLFRAAELTLENGFTHFRMLDEQVDEIEDDKSVVVSGGHGIYSYPLIFGTRISTIKGSSRFEAGAQFKMLKSRPEKDDAYVFDANEIKRNIGPTVVLPNDGKGVNADDTVSEPVSPTA